MKLLGLDYGEKWIGIAFSEGILSQGVRRVSRKQATVEIVSLCRQMGIERLVIGIPEGKIAVKIKDFVAQLKKVLPLPITLWDETLSSYEAQMQLLQISSGQKNRRQKIHQTAAAIMLDTFIKQNKIHEF